MDRKEFLALLGMGAAGVIIPTCMGGCSKDSGASGPTVDFSVDLSNTTYSALKTKGGSYIHSSGVIIGYGTDGKYYAVQATCPHESGQISFNGSSFPCSKHSDNIFSLSGVSNGRQTSSSLKTYTCTLSGTTLSVKG